MGTIDFAVLSLAAVACTALVMRHGPWAVRAESVQKESGEQNALREWCEAQFVDLEARLARRLADIEDFAAESMERLERKRKSIKATEDNPARRQAEPEFDPSNKDHLRARARQLGLN